MSESKPAIRHTLAVVDDQIDLRELVALRLSMVEGLEVVGQAANGVEAINLARDQRPDLMTLDLQMPIMGGVAAIPVLRAVAPNMRIVVFSGDLTVVDLNHANQPDAMVSKGGSLSDLVAIVTGLLSEGAAPDLVEIDLGRLPVHVALEAFDSWVGLNARVRTALETVGDVSADLLGDVPIESPDLLCLMGVFMQFGLPLSVASRKREAVVDLKFSVRRDAAIAARRALLALGGNGTLRAFNKAWSHSPTKEAERALDLVDSLLVEKLPGEP
jgi:CheY-like chemotaxis protein